MEESGGISEDKWNVAQLEQRIKGLQAPDPGAIRFRIRLQPARRPEQPSGPNLEISPFIRADRRIHHLSGTVGSRFSLERVRRE